MSPIVRFARFNIVGALGIGVQLGTVAALAHGLGVNPIAATAVGIGAAVVHNFAWHVRWTWRDRMPPGRSRLRAFGRFVAANGAVSFMGSMALMPVLVGALPPVPANLVTIAACGLGNYFCGGRVCFPQVFHSSKPISGLGFRGSFGNRLPRSVLTCGKPAENRPVP